MIQNQASGGYVPLTRDEVYRVNRHRLAREYGISPREVDLWSMQDYADALAIMEADNALNKLAL